MPFEDLEVITKANAPPEATVTYDHAWRKNNGNGGAKGDKKPRLAIAIPTTICGLAKSTKFKLLLGSGEDLGKLLVRGIPPVKKGDPEPFGITPSEHAHFFRWNFGYVPKLGDDTFEGQKCPVRKISDEEFEITVPASWFEGPA